MREYPEFGVNHLGKSPTRPPAFSGQGVSVGDADDSAPEIQPLAVEQLRLSQRIVP